MNAVRSRFTPLPLGLHLGFCIFATIVFLLIFFRSKRVSNLIWALICDATLILQVYYDKYTALAVGICEIVMFGILIRLWVSDKISAKAKSDDSIEDGEDEPKQDDLEDIAKLVKTERKRLMDDNQNVIDNAFEDE